MAVIALAGVALIALGAVVGDAWLALLGIIVVVAAPTAILIAAIRGSEDRPPREEEGYRDGFFTGAMTVLGFKPSEQAEARRERSKQERD